MVWRVSHLPPHWFTCLPFQLNLSHVQKHSINVGCGFPVCSSAAEPCSRPTMVENPFLCAGVRQACPLHCCQTTNLTPQATLKWTESKRSRKEQLLPALLVLLSRPLLCADSRADFVLGCSHAERGEQEELSYTAGLCLLLLWLWFNHGRVTLYPGTLNEGRNVLTLSLLMEVKAKGVSVQRGDRQPLNVRSSSSKPQLTIHSTSAVFSKWLPICDWSQRRSIHGARIRLDRISLSWCYWSMSEYELSYILVFCFFSSSLSSAHIRSELLTKIKSSHLYL